MEVCSQALLQPKFSITGGFTGFATVSAVAVVSSSTTVRATDDDDNTMILVAIIAGAVVAIVILGIIVYCCCCGGEKEKDDTAKREPIETDEILDTAMPVGIEMNFVRNEQPDTETSKESGGTRTKKSVRKKTSNNTVEM